MQDNSTSDGAFPLLAVVGATGSGKSELALAVAAEFNGEIVNFDSVQLYRGFDVGTAKVPPEGRRGIPHHLLDVAKPSEELTAGEYARRAEAVLDDIRGRASLPLLVGGTGFYLRALLDGLSPSPAAQSKLRERLKQAEARRPGVLHRFLLRFDPASAGRIHKNDVQKVSRAVEMTIAGQRPAAEIQAEPRARLTGYQVLKLGLSPPAAALRERLNLRSQWMFANGLIEETRGLLASGVSPDARPMGSLGYQQALAVIEGRLTVAAAIAECQTRTRQYAKRQRTWFRADKDVRWLPGFGSEPRIQHQACELIRELMKQERK